MRANEISGNGSKNRGAGGEPCKSDHVVSQGQAGEIDSGTLVIERPTERCGRQERGDRSDEGASVCGDSKLTEASTCTVNSMYVVSSICLHSDMKE